MQIIRTDKGYVSGTLIGEPGKEVSIFRGIPYAAPPIGDLRWKRPQPAVPWEGIRECTNFSASPPQFGGPLQFLEQSEDCLYLNVATPAKSASDKLPVMVWFHGGGLDNSTANDPLFNGYRLPQNGVVQIAVSHRLGSIGLVAHPLLSTESSEGVSGNYLFLDMIASLEWVQKNIASFGGNPNNVTIFGESGGGMKVSGMLTSPLAKGLFHRAICESGAAFSSGTLLADAETRGDQLFAKLGVDTLEDARTLSFEKIVEASMALAEELKVMMGLWGVTVDGWCFKDNMQKIIKEGKHNAVPLIVGANLGELGPGVISMPQIIPAYIDMLSGNNKVNVNGYAYIFDQIPAGWKAEGGVSTHAIELLYVFGDYDNSTPYSWPLIYDLETFYGITSTDPGLTPVDKKVSEEVMAIWAQFAKKGDPSIEGLIEWPAWEAATNRYLYIADQLEVKSGFSSVGSNK